MPFLAIFAPAADIGERESAARLQPGEARGSEARRQRDVESAIAIEQRRRGAGRILAAHDEHRHARPVLRGIDHLFDPVIVGRKGDFGFGEHLRFAAIDIEAIDRARLVEAGEAVEGLAVARLPSEARDRSDAGKIEFAGAIAIEIVIDRAAARILHEFDHQPVADDGGAGDGIVALRDHLFPLQGRLRQIGAHDAIARRVLVGHEIDRVAGRCDRAPLVLETGHDIARLPATIRAVFEIDHAQFVAIVGAGRAGNKGPAPVIGHAEAMALLLELRGFIDQLVLALRRAEAVEIDFLVVIKGLEILPLLGLGEARIEEAFIAEPGNAREFRPADLVAHLFAGRDVKHLDRAPVAAAVLDRIGQIIARFRRGGVGKSGGVVRRPGVRIDQQTALAAPPVAHEILRLVHQPGIVTVEIAITRLGRDAEAFVIDQLGEFGLEPLGARKLFEIGIGDDVLRLHPVRHLGIAAHIVFEPAIGIGDLLAENRLAGVGRARFGIIRHGLRRNGCGRKGDERGTGKRGGSDAVHDGNPLRRIALR